MLTPRTLLLALATTVAAAVAPAAAHAASVDPTGFRFASSSYSVHENAGAAHITVTRADAGLPAKVWYVAVGLGHDCGGPTCTATPPKNGDVPEDFGPTSGSLSFPAGVSTESFPVAVVDHHFATINKTVSVVLFTSWNQGIASRSHAVLTILDDDHPRARAANNPLELPVAPGATNPLHGARFFVDPDDAPAQAARAHPQISVIAKQPSVGRFGAFSGKDVGLAVNRFLVRADAQGPGTVPMLSTYRVVDHHCGHWTPTASDVAGYHAFIDRFAQGIGSHPAVLFLEMDSLITAGCLTSQGLAVRMAELRYAIDALRAHCPHLVTYLDAGAADAVPAASTASMLRRAGVAQIQGFFLNSTHYDWTSKEMAFGQRVSSLVGGKHFVVSTSVNGRGPLVPANRATEGNEVLCNAPGRGLGPKPTTTTGYAGVDAFAWIGNPGESGGACRPGAPPTGAYWPAYALMLVKNAVFSVDRTVAVKRAAVIAHMA